MKDKCIILTGGGTAGHVTLNINLEDELYKHFEKVVYIGSHNGIEKELIKKNTKYNYQEIDSCKLTRKKLLPNLKIPFTLSRAIKQAKKIIKTENPSVIFSKGGYVGLPVVIAGKKLGVPVVCHESDISMGLANRLAKRYATTICTNFKLTADKNGQKCKHTGMPLKLSPLTKNQAKTKFKINTNKPVLLVTGGSLGAQALNEFIFKNLDALTKEYFIVHIVGKNNFNKKAKNKDYLQLEFVDDMWTLFKATDFAISRAGANTIVELLSNQILTIFVPLPKTVSRGDQIDNAKFLENLGVSKTILQENLSLEKTQNILNFMKNNAISIKNSINNANFKDGTQNIIKTILTQKNT
jgi:UDP-N-acetylglucosamine--N-acetylmuramyl-(pentapeptide) pyrophosphoryl-undecaprenol N-acetylglucosamine transferase